MANTATAPLLRAEIGRRLLFTAGVLLIYRLGCHVPLPGVDADAAPGVARMLKSEVLSIFGLGLTPFLSVLFVFEFVKLIIPPLSRWETSDPGHAQNLTRIVYLLALACAGFQARGVTNALQDASMLIDGPGWAIVTPLTLVAGTALLCWLGEIITRHGLGNGFWLLVITPALATLVINAAGTFELLRQGSIRSEALFAELGFFAVATALIAMTSKAGGTSTENRVSGADFVSVWPPLLATYVNDFSVTISGVEISFVSQLALLAATIALFNGLQWLGSAPATRRPVWAIALVQIFICVGAELLTHTLQLPFPINGAWLIVIVMTALSCVRALGPQPEALSAKPAV
jgi:preprotein translocase subunit SecY